ncbi:hypothetical protein [Miltoncostaea marina]|uniref:hypothetical protein n=1 Tax=Miltoncostaea marina TaxID=2843215 RepID=UPI001C3DA90F|nr:hypothetical protein [Miltoncostaea marina]
MLTTLALVLAPAAAAAAAGAPAAAPVELAPGPPNGDLSAGLAGWEALGVEPVVPLGRGVRVHGNTTLVSPPLALPPGAQTLRVTVRAPAGGALLEVRARPEAGGPEVRLGELEPGRARRSLPVGVAGLAGTTVRIVIDPVPALGTSVEVHRVGPVTAPMPRWRVVTGALEVAGARGRRSVRVADAPLELVSPAVRRPRGARELTLQVRGDGLLRARAGARPAVARALARWRTVRVALPRRGATARLRLRAVPGPGGMELRRIGAPAPARARTTGPSAGSGSR